MPVTLPYAVANGINADGAQMQANLVALQTAINRCVWADGSVGPSAALNMGGYKIYNGVAGVLPSDFAIVSQLVPLDSPGFTGVPTVPTASLGTATAQIASTSFVMSTLALSPTLSGTPLAPTAGAGTNTNQIATTAFVQGERASRISSAGSTATLTPTSAFDQFNINAQAAALTIANATGFGDGQGFLIRIKDNGSAQAISYGAAYRGVGLSLPTTTVPSKVLYLGVINNAFDGSFDVVSAVQQ